MRHVLSYHITHLLALYLKDLSGLCLHNSGCCKILYADNILFNSPSIRQLEKLLHACKEELYWLDVAVDFKKSCCLTIGARCDTHCANSPSVTGSMLLRMNTVRYLGVYFARAKYFKCSFSHGKRSFHRADNSIFEKNWQILSEESVPKLIKGKCTDMPILLYMVSKHVLSKILFQFEIAGICHRSSLHEII